MTTTEPDPTCEPEQDPERKQTDDALAALAAPPAVAAVVKELIEETDKSKCRKRIEILTAQLANHDVSIADRLDYRDAIVDTHQLIDGKLWDSMERAANRQVRDAKRAEKAAEEKAAKDAKRGSAKSGHTPAEDPADVDDAPNRGSAISGHAWCEARATFTRWLGKEYDLGVLDATLAVGAAEQLGGDPPWLLIVGGSGVAKTETVMALTGANSKERPVIVTSTLTGEAALLSGTSETEWAGDAHGGLLCQIGERGILVIKDVTSILSMSRDARAAVLAALREVYDGNWDRVVGTDGGRTLKWKGRLVLVGAVTTAWDTAHSVIAVMGDRFPLVRMDSTTDGKRKAAGRQALANVSSEIQMRRDLALAVRRALRSVDTTQSYELDDVTKDHILDLADAVTLARTAVEHDYQGNVIEAHAPEMPTRFAKQLAQIVRGGMALGMAEEQALSLAVRVAGDSVPPLRLKLLQFVAAHPGHNVAEIARGIQAPRKTVDRVLQALHLLGLLFFEYDKQIKKDVYILNELTVKPEIVRALATRRLPGNAEEAKEDPARETANSDDVNEDATHREAA